MIKRSPDKNGEVTISWERYEMLRLLLESSNDLIDTVHNDKYVLNQYSNQYNTLRKLTKENNSFGATEGIRALHSLAKEIKK